MGLCIVFFGLIYMMGKCADNRVRVIHRPEKIDFSRGKILGDKGQSMYKRKKQVLSKRIKKVESRFKDLDQKFESIEKSLIHLKNTLQGNQNQNHSPQLNPDQGGRSPHYKQGVPRLPLGKQSTHSNNSEGSSPNLIKSKSYRQSRDLGSQAGDSRWPKGKTNNELGDSAHHSIGVQSGSHISENEKIPFRSNIHPQKISNMKTIDFGSRERLRKERGPSIVSFPVQQKKRIHQMAVKIPSGSFVKAKLLTGIEAPEGKALPVLLQADYAFVGPNKSRIDLTGCFLIAKSSGNLSIERIEMQVTKISCVSKSGRMFDKPVNGFVADAKDNSFAVMGEVNSKQDRVAAMAFLSSVVEGVSKSLQQLQTTTQTHATGVTSSFISGKQGKYIAAGGIGGAASQVTQWYLSHAQNLLPTIHVDSGRDVWLIMQDTVELPNWYFRKSIEKRTSKEGKKGKKGRMPHRGFTYLSRFLEN